LGNANIFVFVTSSRPGEEPAVAWGCLIRRRFHELMAF
jgi:hypothetical protein